MVEDLSRSRRGFLKHVGALGASAFATTGRGLGLTVSGGLLTAGVAHASEKKKFEQAPGFFRFKLGETLITIVSDGHLTVPAHLFAVNKPEAEVKAFLKSTMSDTVDSYVHTNVCVIDTGDRVVMVDSGAGDKFQSGAGRLVRNLLKAGYEPSDIDSIILTHGHPDHAWGIIDDETGSPNFPNASYFVNGVEWDYWTDKELASRLPKQMAPMALGAQRNLLPVEANTKRVKPGDEVAPGVTLVDSSGHTVGHVSVRVTSGSETALILGDVLVHPYISLERPDWHFAYDAEVDKAVETRQKMLDMLANERILTVCYHLPFPGVGYVGTVGRSYRWLPVNWHWQL